MRKTWIAAALLLAGACLSAQVSPPPQSSPQPAITPQQRPRTMVIMAGPPPSPSHAIWVLQGKNQLLMYDGDQFKQWRGVTLPPEAHEHPENVVLGRGGQVLYRYASDGHSATRYWCSDPRHPELVGGAYEQRPAGNGDSLITTAAPDVYFSGDGQQLYWFETRSVTRAADSDKAREASFLAWSTDLDS